MKIQTGPLAPDWLPLMAPVEHCITNTMIPIVVRPSMGDSRSPDPGSNPGRSTISNFHPTRYFWRMIGTIEIPTDAMRAIVSPIMPTPSNDMISDSDISIRKEPLVD